MRQSKTGHKYGKVPSYPGGSEVISAAALVVVLLQVSERIQTNTERLGYFVALWDDLRLMEQDINQWSTGSIADLTDSITNLADKERTEGHLVAFQVRVQLTSCVRGCGNDDGSVTFRRPMWVCVVTTPQAELEKREQSLEALQERVTELKERAKVQETPLQMQVIEIFKSDTAGIW